MIQLPVELSLALRYLSPRRTFVSVITLLSIFGVTIGVCVLIVVISVMTGVRERLDEKIIGFNAHLTVASGQMIYDSDKLVALIEKDPDVVAATGFIRGPVLSVHNHAVTPVIIKSVPSEGDDPVLPLKKFLIAGNYELRGDSVLVGYEWARQNEALIGDSIDLYGPAQFANFAERNHAGPQTTVLPDTPIIRGIFRTGQYDYDQNFFIVSTEMAQHIYTPPSALNTDGVQAIAVRVKNPDEAAQVKDRLNKILPPPLHARTWMDDNRDLFNALATERVTMSFILFMVMVVAAFGLCTTLITITVQKSREIGLMKALGATDFQVALIFILHGFIVGLIGAITGVSGALTILTNLKGIRHFLLDHFGIEVFAGSVYNSTEIPYVISPILINSTALAALIICVVAALLPAINAARLAPARALRYE